MRLIAIGIVAGVFSALLGVGGGLIAVPLLILFAHVPERAATATSLGAIGITALAGVIAFAYRGEVELRVRGARRASGRRRRLSRNDAAAADHDAASDLRLRAFSSPASASGSSSRDDVHHRSRNRPRPRRRRDVRALRSGGWDPLRPDARRARARADRGPGDLAAGDPADGCRGRGEPAPLREPSRPNRARRRSSLRCWEWSSAPGSRPRSRRPR